MPLKLPKPLTPWWEEIEGARFKLRPLTRLELMECYAQITFKGDDMIGRGIGLAAQKALLDWEGVLDHAGQPAPCTPRNFDILPLGVVTLLGVTAMNQSEIGAEEEKNSGSPSRSAGQDRASTAPDAPGESTATSGTRRRSDSGRSKG